MNTLFIIFLIVWAVPLLWVAFVNIFFVIAYWRGWIDREAYIADLEERERQKERARNIPK